MAVIHILSLDANMERAIPNKQYSEEQVAELNKKIQADTKKKKKIFWITMIIVAVSWFAAAGNIMRKWNNLIKVFYPSVYAMKNEVKKLKSSK